MAEGEEKTAQLTALEMAHLASLQARAEAAEARKSAKHFELAALRANTEANILKMQESHRQADAKVRAALDDLRVALEAAKDEHNKWTAGVAAKYGVNWAGSVYNEMTGALSPAPKE